MENKPEYIYRKCLNCHTYFQVDQNDGEEETEERLFCCYSCAETFTQCPTCGKYVSIRSVIEGQYCSHECAIDYTKKRIERTDQ